MNRNRFSRTEALIGKSNIVKLEQSKVAIFGIGGVGSFTAEALARAGIGKIVLVDYDIIDITNINRQIHALESTIGLLKVEAMKERLLLINPDLKVEAINKMYKPNNSHELLKIDFDYVVDAIDMVSSKIDLVTKTKKMGIPIISSMGAGNKLNPVDFKVDDIYNTNTCPLARVMRRELKKNGVTELKVVYSKEIPINCNMECTDKRKAIPGSISFVPSTVGLIVASEVIKDIISL